MNNMSSINFALLTQGINCYVPIPLLFFGIIGNILNILVFTRRIFRQNICVQYFLASTPFDSIVIIVGVLSRFFNGFGHDHTQISASLCKIRCFLTYFAGYTYKLYAISTIHMTKSSLQKSIENTVFNLTIISLFLNNTITFYICTLFGKIFRFR